MLTLTRDAFWISPYVFSCFVALEEKQLPYDVVEISLGDGAQNNSDYARKTVTARVPALLHTHGSGAFALAESSAIIEYLEDTFPEHRVLPTDAEERARARQIMSWVRSDDTLPMRNERPTHTMFYERAKTPLSPEGRRAADKLMAVCGRLFTRGQTSLFSAFSIADADLAFMVQRLLMNGDDVSEEARAFTQAQWKRPSVVKFMSLPRKAYVPY